MAEYEPMTIETGAAIGAFIQELHIRGAGGKPVDEETLALRMLAATHASPDYDYTMVRSLNPSDAPVTAAADGGDRFDKLAAMLMGDVKPAATQAAEGNVPKAPPVVVFPSYTNQDVSNNYATLMDATATCQLYANLMQVAQKPEGFNITSEAGLAYNFQAKMAFDAMMGPMAGYYSFGSGLSQTYNDTIPKNQVHAHLLGKLFDGFSFDADTKTKLDAPLSNFVAGLKNIHSQGNPTNTFDFMLRLNLVPRINVTGSDSDPIYVYQPTTYLIYMKIDANTFYQSTSKSGGEDRITFKFSITTTKCELNSRRFEQNRATFDQLFMELTQNNMRTYSELLNTQIKSKESNPGGK
ncbi:hypothetical protein E0Z10_g10889 [Xylaria hypoxylon]|uniref:Uncharacterized protein n=1 Tax=Xylaria hypoxylon TaxID=37992 RepID=A0A4Z0Y0R3_9PEZI|nr:hypothetical protein E0Z10_g10889 [Xylaria hypoxylon]